MVSFSCFLIETFLLTNISKGRGIGGYGGYGGYGRGEYTYSLNSITNLIFKKLLGIGGYGGYGNGLGAYGGGYGRGKHICF